MVCMNLPLDNEEISHRVTALKLIGQIQEFANTKLLEQSEEDELLLKIQTLEILMCTSKILQKTSSTIKWHHILRTIPTIIKKYHTFSWFLDQGIENLHKKFNDLSRKICTHDQKIVSQRLIEQQWIENFIQDTKEVKEIYPEDDENASLQLHMLSEYEIDEEMQDPLQPSSSQCNISSVSSFQHSIV